MPFTVQQKIDIAKVAQPLSYIAIKKGGLFGGGEDLSITRKIYCVRKNVEWLYTLDNADTSLFSTSNFLIALCNKFYLQANALINGGSGGVVVNPSHDTYVFYSMNVVVPVSGDGLNTYRNDVMVGATQLNSILWNNAPLTIAGGDFTFNALAGEITLLNGNFFSQGDVILAQFNRLIS